MNGTDLETPHGASATDAPGSPYDRWETIPWDAVYRHVSKLQTRIAKATREGQSEKVRRLQRALVRSLDARLLAVRTVTTSGGRNTPVIDGVLWKSPASKLRAAKALACKGYRAKPLRRVNIPKRGKPGQTRPLGIPTMRDRAMQALWALALGPVAESTGDRDSFGFRRGRCAQDACQKLFIALARRDCATWVLEGDIKGCFDHISHVWLLENVPMDRRVLAQFLRAGYMEQGAWHETSEGTPQGSVISPILANLALDGMEGMLDRQFTLGRKGTRYSEKARRSKVHLVRYADDFVDTAATPEVAEEAKAMVAAFLSERGLELSEEKTLVTHIDEGFDFLGWNFRKYDGKLLVKPSKRTVNAFLSETHRLILSESGGMDADGLIRALTPKVRGFASYHRHTCCSGTFSHIRHVLRLQLERWACRRHPKKCRGWVYRRYWCAKGNDRYVFGTQEHFLAPITWHHVVRHTALRTDMNPYLDRKYFDKRRAIRLDQSRRSFHMPAAIR